MLNAPKDTIIIFYATCVFIFIPMFLHDLIFPNYLTLPLGGEELNNETFACAKQYCYYYVVVIC
mgnify:CR=1 FL=1